MNIIKRTKNDSYSIICNTALRDTRLSLQAKGLFTYIMTLPDNWIIYRTEIEKHAANGKDSHRAAFNELIRLGYVQCKRIRNDKGQLQNTEYVIKEVPKIQDENSGLPYCGKPNVGAPNVGSPAAINNLPLVSTDSNKIPPNPPQAGEDTEELLSLKTNNTSVDFKSVNMDNIISDAKSIKSKDNKEFKNLPPSVQRCISETIKFLNGKRGTKFRADNQTTIKHIINRLKEGYTLSDFKKVIVNQYYAWKDNEDMKQYLRPATLFSTSKIESYLNNNIKQKKRTVNHNRVGVQSQHTPAELDPEHFYERSRP